MHKISVVTIDHHPNTKTSCMKLWDGLIPLQAAGGGRSISSHEAATLWHSSQALQVMNCLLDIYPSQGRIAAVQHGTATAAILWLAISLPSHFSGPQRNLSHAYSHAHMYLSTCQHVQSQAIMWLPQDAHTFHTAETNTSWWFHLIPDLKWQFQVYFTFYTFFLNILNKPLACYLFSSWLSFACLHLCYVLVYGQILKRNKKTENELVYVEPNREFMGSGALFSYYWCRLIVTPAWCDTTKW